LRLLIAFFLLFIPAPAAFAACNGQLIEKNVLNAPVCIPANPQRIVTLDPLLSYGALTELGVEVIGAPLFGIQDADIRARAEKASVVDIGHPAQPSLERVTALKPDLIIGSSEFHGQIYNTVSKIAPTLFIDHIDWKDHIALLARITGQADKANEARQVYENRVASIRSRVPDVKVSVARVKPGGFNVYVDGPAAYAPYAVLHEAGIKRTAFETVTDNTIVKRLDWEGASSLNGDILLYVVVSGYDPAPDEALMAETLANPFWQLLPAVAAGRAHRIDRATWMGFHGYGSANRVLDDIERFILPVP